MKWCSPLLILLTISPAWGATNWREVREQALKNSPALHELRESLKSAEYLRKARYSEFMPALDLKASQVESENDPKSPTDIEEVKKYGAEASLSVFEGFGSLARLGQAQATVRGRRAELYEREAELHYELRTSYFRCLIASQRQEMAERILKRQQDNARFIHLKYQAGAEALWSYNMALAEAKEAELSKQEQLNEMRKAKLELARLIGENSVGDDSKMSFSEKAEDLIDRRLSNAKANPDSFPSLLRISAEMSLAEEELREVESEYYPSVKLGASWNKQTFDDRNTVDTQEVGVTATWSIFDGLSTYNKVQSTRSKQEALRSRMSDGIRQVEVNVEQRRLDFELSLSKLPVARQSLEAARERLKTVTTQYRSGLKKFLDWEQANSHLIRSEQDEIAALESILLAQTELEKALGTRLTDKL